MSNSPTIIDDPVTPATVGEMLREDFLDPLGMSVADLAAKVDVSEPELRALIVDDQPINAELDLLLGRYLGLSEGFFLRFQASRDLRVARMRLQPKLARIQPRLPQAA